jgi:hypothetical protein
MPFECIVLKEEGGSSRRVGGIINRDQEPLEDRITRISSDLRGKFILAETYELPSYIAHIIEHTEKSLGREDVALRHAFSLVYLQGRMDMRNEMVRDYEDDEE